MPRAGLSHAVVVAEAARLADEAGLDGLTLAALAERLGVAVPSLYKHVDGLPALRRDLAVLAVGELGAALADALANVRSDVPAPGDRLQALADTYRGYARSHPGRYAATLRAPAPGDIELARAAERVLETGFDVLSGYGLTDDDAVDATRALRAALHGFVALEAAGGFGIPRDVDRSFERLVEALDAALRALRPVAPPGPVRELRLALTVDDCGAALRFYRDALGLPVVLSWDGPSGSGSVLAAGRATLELISRSQAELIDRVEVGRRVSGPVRLALEVPDSTATAETLVAAGAELLGGPVVTPWAHRNARVLAPDGMQLTLFTVLEEPPAPVPDETRG
jgi:AcrR family transcriptional regulator/catechol 2,3-dioxygenase-like lactoylglutathione lyase family enzyme